MANSSVPAETTPVLTPAPTPKVEVTSGTMEVPEPGATKKAPRFEVVLGAATLYAVYLFGRRR